MVCWGAFPPMGPADSKERSTHPAKKSRLIPTWRWRTAILRGAISSPVASRKPRARFSAAAERKLEIARRLVIRYNIAVLKADQEQMDRAVALARGKRRAEHWMAHEQALALARSGRLQAARRSSNRAMDLALQEGEREAAASYQAARAVWEAVCGNAAEAKRNAHGGAGAFEWPGCRIRRRPCPGSFGRFFSIGSARRRFGKALSGRYVREVYLRTSSSRVGRAGAGQAGRQRGAAANRSAL